MSQASYPRLQARSRRFTLGVPRSFTSVLGPEGPVVLFLRSDAGDDPVAHLWRHDPGTGRTHKLLDAHALATGDATPSAEEQALRERTREQSQGIVAYATDDDARLVACSLDGRLYTVDVPTGTVVHHPTGSAVLDPRPAPDGRAVAFHAAGGLHLLELADGPTAPGRTRALVEEPDVAWGRAEFIAAEEMGRTRGFWWSPDSTTLAVARVDERDVSGWTLADPAAPWQPARVHRYPAAGTANADVQLWLVDVGTAERRQVTWSDRDDGYLATVRWERGPLTLLVQSRDQRVAEVRTVDPETARTRTARGLTDPAWVEPVPGMPAWAGGRLITVEDRAELGAGGTRAVCLDGQAVSPAGLQVRELLSATPVGGDVVLEVLATPADDPMRTDAYRIEVGGGGRVEVTSETASEPAGVRRRIPGRATGGGDAAAAPWVEVAAVLGAGAPSVVVGWRTTDTAGQEHLRAQPLEVRALDPGLTPRPRLLQLGSRGLQAALFLPSDDDGQRRLPVLLDPYGGPHAQRVVASDAAFWTSQWLADQGFAVLVVDGRGTPGRGPAFERAVHGDLAGPVLEDQLAALDAAAELEPRLDRARVAIRGWSFGGTLAALAVLRRPDRFRAAVAGAPVTDWHLYDTHYTERYLGHPDAAPECYRRSSLVTAAGELPGAAAWDPDRPPRLLLLHGLADDNVVVAHTLRLSAALLADGRDHQVLPLSGVTHMTPQEVVAERLLTAQVRFLRDALT
ncbi:MAG: prolyl oligopeptidase family serine peptidase [Nitriliruptoraceae bacterium]